MVIDLEKFNHAQKILVKRIEKYHKDVPYRKSISNDFLQKELKFSGEFLNIVIAQCMEKNTIYIYVACIFPNTINQRKI